MAILSFLDERMYMAFPVHKKTVILNLTLALTIPTF